MHWRSLISGLLILVLMPAWSLAASCDFYCDTTAPANADAVARAAHHPRSTTATQNHHHESGMENVAAGAQATRPATNDEPSFSGHSCCEVLGANWSTSCVAPQPNARQEGGRAPKC